MVSNGLGRRRAREGAECASYSGWGKPGHGRGRYERHEGRRGRAGPDAAACRVWGGAVVVAATGARQGGRRRACEWGGKERPGVGLSVVCRERGSGARGGGRGRRTQGRQSGEVAVDEAGCGGGVTGGGGGSIPLIQSGAQRRGEGEATAAWRRQRRAPSLRSRDGTGSGSLPSIQNRRVGRRGARGVGVVREGGSERVGLGFRASRGK